MTALDRERIYLAGIVLRDVANEPRAEDLWGAGRSSSMLTGWKPSAKSAPGGWKHSSSKRTLFRWNCLYKTSITDLLFTDAHFFNEKLLDYPVWFNTERPHCGFGLNRLRVLAGTSVQYVLVEDRLLPSVPYLWYFPYLNLAESG